MSLVSVLEGFLEPLWEQARAMGLEPVDVEFEVVPSQAIYEMAAYGMPGHYQHWTFGRDYWRMKQRMDQGHGRLYEMVIDTDPAVAYLLESNTVAAQKLVMTHVVGHADVFRNHTQVAGGRKAFHHTLEAARERFAQYGEEYGVDAVETTLDRALSIQFQVAEEKDAEPPPWHSADPYQDLWQTTPQGFGRRTRRTSRYRLPSTDLLGFIARYSPILEPWERDICQVIRQEGLYLAPKRAIKIIHEGWATFCHHRMLPSLPLSVGEQVETARLHAAVAQADPLRLNPYWFGWQFAESLVETYGLARARSILMEETDASLVRNYLDETRIRALQLYTYDWVRGEVRTPRGPVATWDAVRQETDAEALRNALANALAARPPQIEVRGVGGDGSLELHHLADDTVLDPQWARMTLDAIAALWGSGVTLHDGANQLVKTS